MKVRNGFVSNSSSSSFVVVFDKKPESVEELKALLFGEDTLYPDPYDEGGYPAEQVAETVWRDLNDEDTHPLTPEEVREEFSTGYIYEIKGDYPEYPWGIGSKSPEEWRKAWDEYDRARHEVTDKLADEFLKEHEGKVFYRFSYSDNDGSYFCALEHGGLFDRLPHQAISHH